MGVCKTCKWWSEGECEFVQWGPQSTATRFEIDVRVSDDHGLEVKLSTGPDFGCVHHEDKPDGR